MSPTFEAARESEFETLLGLRILVMREHLERQGRFDPEVARARFRASFSPETTRHIVLSGIRVGCIGVSRQPDGLHIDHFYIEPELQNKGIGALVLARIIDEAQAARSDLRVLVLKQTPAQRFYERAGFTLEAEQEVDLVLRRPYQPV